MARSLAALGKRRKTIKTTQKITNAMKLVSLSKLQRFRQRQQQSASYVKHLMTIPNETVVSEKKKLYLAFTPDLGLVSAYTKGLIGFIRHLNQPSILLIGNQGYDQLNLIEDCHVLNKKISSEIMSVDTLIDICQQYQLDYQIVVIKAVLSQSMQLSFELVDSEKQLVNDFQLVFEPNYNQSNQAFQKSYTKAVIVQSYYECKTVEHLMRRIAMEKATESADNMLHDLQIQYNRLRQEKITEEIGDLMSEEV